MADPSRKSTVRTAATHTALAALLLAPTACTAGGDEEAPERDGSRELTSCTPSTPDDTDADDPARIVFTHMQNGTRETALNELIDEFNAANPDIVVLPQTWIDGPRALMDQWSDQAPEERPAVALMPRQHLGVMADSDLIVAPGDCLREVVPDVLPAMEESWSLDGELQAVPFAVSTPLLYYNRYLFEEAGLDPGDPPGTFEEALDSAPTLMEDGPAYKALVFDTAVEGGGSWFVEQTLAKAGLPSVLPDNGRGAAPADHVNWRAAPVVDALTRLQTMRDEGRTLWVRRNPRGRTDLERAGRPGQLVAMAVHTSAALGELEDILDRTIPVGDGNPVVDFAHIDLDVAPILGPGPGSGSLVGGDALWLSADHTARELDAAWRLVTWLSSPEVGARWAAATGYVPISESMAAQPVLQEEWRLHPVTREAYDILAGVPTTEAALGPVAGPLPEMHEILADTVEDVVVHGADPAEALDDASDQADALLAAYNGAQPAAGGGD